MAQYDPIVIKGGFLTVLGTDTLRDDLTAKALLTTTALATGDVCQMNGDAVLAKALNTNADPCVGVYNGETSSIVQEGAVAVTLAAGVVLANGDAVYLAAQPGRVTNVKPTTDMLHELGVVLDAASATIFWQPRPVVVRAASTMMFDARSSWLLQGDTPPAQPGEQQPFPSTAAALLASLGSPGGVVAANVRGAYLCADVGNQLDTLGIGPALVPGGGPLDSREAVGLPQAASFMAKVAVELLGGSKRYGDVGNVYADANGSIVTTLTVFRINPNTAATETWIVTKKVPGPGGIGWALSCSATYLRATGIGATTTQYASIAVDPRDGGWHYAIVSVNDTTKVVTLHSDLGSATSAAYTGSVTNASSFHFGCAANDNFSGQIAACYVLDAALVAADGVAFWRSFSLTEFNTLVSHARIGPLIVPISASRVACYGGGNIGQPAVGFNSNFVAGTDNLLKTGTVHEDGITFEPIGSDNGFGNFFSVVAVGTSVDGASGMRDGVRATMLGNWFVDYARLIGSPIVGVSNIPWRYDADYRRATVGTTGQLGLIFTGSGAGIEYLTVLTDAATPVDWTRGGGSVTPVNADQTLVYPAYGATLAAQDCDFSEWALVKNRSTAALAWRRVGTAAAASTATPVTSITNVGNARYSPVKGTAVVRIAGFQGTSGAFFFTFGAAGADGALTLSYNAGQMILRIWDAAAALVDAVNCGAVNTAEHTFTVAWNSTLGTMSVSEGGVVLGSSAPGAWTPEAGDVAPLYIGCDSAGTGAARCNVALLQLVNT